MKMDKGVSYFGPFLMVQMGKLLLNTGRHFLQGSCEINLSLSEDMLNNHVESLAVKLH